MRRNLIRLLLFLLLASTGGNIRAQSYGNEWYNPAQSYIKIGILQTGIYRVDYFALEWYFREAGISIGAISTTRYQIWSRGKQIPIRVIDGGDDRINPGDFLEFVGTPADGSMDTDMYTHAGAQPNTRRSLISDTAYYFVTISNNGPWLRYQQYNNTDYSSHTPESWILHEAWQVEQQSYFRGIPVRVLDKDLYPSEYNDGEGWMGTPFGYGSSDLSPEFVVSFNTIQKAAGGPAPRMEYCFVGASNYANRVDHRLRGMIQPNGSGGRQILDTTFRGHSIHRRQLLLQAADLGNVSTVLRLQPVNLPGIPVSSYQLAYVVLKYPRKTDMEGNGSWQFSIPASPVPRLYEWTGSGISGAPVAIDAESGVWITAQPLGTGRFRFIVPPSSAETHWFIADSTRYRTVSMHKDSVYQVQLAVLPDFRTHINNAEYIIITHPSLMGPEIEAYLRYREGSFASQLVTTEQLYNAFSYGQKHPIAIRRYARYLLDKSAFNPPKYLLLVGRGYETIYLRSSRQYQLATLVPSIGVPASDNLFTLGLNGTQQEPAIPTGRIPADRRADIANYLNKVIEYEGLLYKLWQKDVLHMGGGSDASQSNFIKQRLDQLKVRAETDLFSGRVTSFYKAATGQQTVGVKQGVINAINNGLSMITFLGHGSTQVTDIDMGDTANYFNKGKYPICYFNGCQIGNPCIPYGSRVFFSERMLRGHNRGAVAFLSQSSLSELFSVSSQMGHFYNAYYGSEFGNRLGDVIKRSIVTYQEPSSILNRIHCQQLFLMGDPALKFTAPDLPDYAVTERGIFIDPPGTIALSDSFRVGVVVNNLGRRVSDSVSMYLRRTYPDGLTRREYVITVPPITFQDTFYFILKSKDMATRGDNLFEVEVNPDRASVEFTHTNNRASAKRFIPGNGVNLVYPRRFAIVSKDTVELVIQPSDLTVSNEQYFVELDTVPRFNSPWTRRSGATNSEPLLRLKFPLNPPRDSMVYYWRARINTGSPEGGRWTENSFTYIKDHPEGWMQQAAWQYSSQVSRNLHRGLLVDTLNRRLRFGPVTKKLYVDAQYANRSNKGVKEGGFGAVDLNALNCADGLVCMLFDPNKNELTWVDTSKMKPLCYWGRTWTVFGHVDNYQLYYTFPMGDSFWQDEFVRFLSLVPDSTYVAIFTSRYAYADTWKPEVYQALNSIGSNIMDNPGVQLSTACFVSVGKKGALPGSAQEDVAVYTGPGTGYAAVVADLYGSVTAGSMVSEPIGPAGQWYDLWYYPKERDLPQETFQVSVLGIDRQGREHVLIPNASRHQDLRSIDSNTYRFIRLRLDMSDRNNFTPMQMGNWRVTFADVPEGTLFPLTRLGFQYHRDTLYEGDTFRLRVPFTNISRLAFKDSIKARLYIMQKESRDLLVADSGWLKALQPGETALYSGSMQTTGLRGHFSAVLDVNPLYQQPELTLQNNSHTFSFFVQPDRMGPLLDVTFDGRHIFNGEIVSANPHIHISSKDENRFLLQTDSSGFDVLLRRPGAPDFVPVPVDGSILVFTPGKPGENQAALDFRPEDLSDGVHTLRVQSRDASGNASGKAEYEVDFNVVNKSSVTNFYPYPNPFTSNMRFVFTLTGREIPDDIRIKIMTVDGRVVRNVNREELGSLRIGNNISEWSWDGTDQFGDRLANGVYFYHVTVRNGGEDLSLRSTRGDEHFKNQVGKIYLMR
jgi:hypothetical protein